MLGLVIPFLAVGAACFIGAVIAAMSTRDFLARGRATTGTVVALPRSVKGTYRAVVEYQTPHGPAKFHDIVGSNPPAFRVGQQVPVLYDLEKPTAARIATTLRLWFTSWLLLVLGAIFGGIGALVLTSTGT